MTEEQAKECPFNPFDLTKVWSQKQYPLIEVGVLELNRNPENYFADVNRLHLIRQMSFRVSASHPTVCFKVASSLMAIPSATVWE